MRLFLPILILLLYAAPAAGIEVDGRIDPVEWQGATHVTDFKMVEPFTGAATPYPTEAWYMATPKGLAVGFRCRTPEGIAQPRQKTRRDESAEIDRVNVMLDFNGDGRSGYTFMITASGGIEDATIGNGGDAWSNDWDGNWQHAFVDGKDEWSAEFLIPWSIAPMPKAVDGKRSIGLYLDRVVGSTRERMAWPAITFKRAQFIGQFAQIELPAHSQSLLAITPYAVVGRDLVHARNHTDAGADLFWKPSGQFQLSATINPDFGQVESDGLVVNFGAEETFYGDKRAFFTENQSLFDLRMVMDNSNLLYTRRVGGWADDDSGPGDITGAVKLNGSVGAVQYGVFLADERGDAGRNFGALRLLRGSDTASYGAMLTHVRRPWLSRTATVLGFDHVWEPGDGLVLSSTLVGSDIATRAGHRRDMAGTFLLEKSLAQGWRHTVLFMHFGDAFEVNDFGYLSRNDLNYGQWEVRRQSDHLPDTSAYVSHDWRWRIEQGNNVHGLLLLRKLQFSLESHRRDGGKMNFEARLRAPAHDDQITRGHGPMRTRTGAGFEIEREFARRGDFDWTVGLDAGFGGGLRRARSMHYAAWVGATWFASDALSVDADLHLSRHPEWIVWRGDNLVASYQRSQIEMGANLNWNISSKQELRIKLEALGLQAADPQPWRVQPDGRSLRSNDVVQAFGLRNLGFQIRYRYELAPLSAIYVVYGRGGDLLDHHGDDAVALLGDAFRLRDAEQLLVKFAYRFEL